MVLRQLWLSYNFVLLLLWLHITLTGLQFSQGGNYLWVNLWWCFVSSLQSWCGFLPTTISYMKQNLSILAVVNHMIRSEFSQIYLPVPKLPPKLVQKMQELAGHCTRCEYGSFGLWGKHFIINTDQNIAVWWQSSIHWLTFTEKCVISEIC